jgi:hypothetical protein
VNKTVNGRASHFTQLAILTNAPLNLTSTPTPSPKLTNTPTPSPTNPVGNTVIVAAGTPNSIPLKIGPFTISPLEANPGEKVGISFTVQNAGGQNGTGTVTLLINGAAESAKDVPIAAGKSENVTFTVSREEAGRYLVDVGGQVSVFTVKGATVQVASASDGWWLPLYGWILTGVGIIIVIAAGLYWWWRKRSWIY